MKFIITNNATGEKRKYRATAWTSFENDVHEIYRFGDPKMEIDFIVDGKVVNLDGAIKAAADARQAWEDKREATKRPIRVLVGASSLPSNWHTVWVNK
jgi:hypothetical protein